MYYDWWIDYVTTSIDYSNSQNQFFVLFCFSFCLFMHWMRAVTLQISWLWGAMKTSMTNRPARVGTTRVAYPIRTKWINFYNNIHNSLMMHLNCLMKRSHNRVDENGRSGEKWSNKLPLREHCDLMFMEFPEWIANENEYNYNLNW